MEKPREHRVRDMWKRIPWEVRADIVERIKAMKDGDVKTILLLAFERGMSTTDIAYYCEDNNITSRNSRPFSRRRIQQIIAENVPEYNEYQNKGQAEAQKRRSDHYKFLWQHREKQDRCAFCGGTNRVEWHHMIPVFLGGTADERNMVCACHACHRQITDYQAEIYPEKFNHKE